MVYSNEYRRTQSSKMPVQALLNQCFLTCPHWSAIFQRSQKRAEKAQVILVRRSSTDSYDASTPHEKAPKSPKKTLNNCGKPHKSGTISNRHARALARQFQRSQFQSEADINSNQFKLIQTKFFPFGIMGTFNGRPQGRDDALPKLLVPLGQAECQSGDRAFEIQERRPICRGAANDL